MGQHSPLRSLIVLIVATSLLLTACSTTQPPRTFRVGIVYASMAFDPLITGLKGALADLGYVEGKNIVYIYDKPNSTTTNSQEQLSAQVQKLIQDKVDLIVTAGSPATLVAQKATAGTALPVIFVPIGDQVKAGLVESLAKPGANLTGVATLPEQQGKRLEYLLKTAPSVKRVYIPYDATDTSASSYLTIMMDVGAKLGLELVTQPVKTTDEAATAINTIPANVDAIFTLPSGPLIANRAKDLIAISLDKKLPLCMSSFTQVEDGALLAYNSRTETTGKQTARMVKAILEGAKPADTPVETVESFLAINLKTAAAIGLTVPDTLLREANTIVR